MSHHRKSNKKKKYLYVLFFGGNGLTSSIIKLATKAPYVHSAIALDSSLKRIYSFNLKFNLTQWNPNIKNGFFQESIMDYEGSLPYWLYRIKVTKSQYLKIKYLIDLFKNNPSITSYNIPGALGFLFPELWEKELQQKMYSFTCSEFIAYMIQSSGIAKFYKPLYTIAPVDILNLKQLKLISSGSIEELISLR